MPRTTVPGMDARALLAELRERGIRVRANGNRLVCDAPRGALTAEMQAAIRVLKTDLLRHLATETVSTGLPELRPLPRGGPLPLGLVQRRMWLMDRLEPGSTVNNLPGAWRLTGSLQRDAFEAAVREIVRRHEVLRTSIQPGEPEPYQHVAAKLAVHIPLADLSPLPESARHAELLRLIGMQRDQLFDLASAPLFRIALYRLGPEEHVFSLVPHHVIWDGWSWDVFLAELAVLYTTFRDGQPSPLPELAVQYADYVAWHRALMEGPEYARQMNYWQARLAGPLPVLEVPADRERPVVPSHRAERRIIDIDQDLIVALRTLGRREDATLFMVLLTAYVAWLHRLSGQHDITVGVPTQDRLHAGADRLIGVLVNTLVIRSTVFGGDPFRVLLRQVRDACVEAYDHQDVPFDRLVDELVGPRSRSHAPLFQTLFVYQDVRDRPAMLGDLRLDQVHIDTQVVPTDLLFGFMVGADHAVGLLDFDADLFEPHSMDRLATGFAALLGDVAADPDRAVDRLYIASGERRSEAVEGDRLRLVHAMEVRSDGAAPAGVLPAPTPTQTGMWSLERLNQGTAVHHLPAAVELRGPLDVTALVRACAYLGERHDVLRWCFPDRHGSPVIDVRPQLGDVLEVEAVSRSANPREACRSVMREAARRPFDIGAGPLVRATLVRLGAEHHVLQLVLHHLVTDEHSNIIILGDLAAAYSQFVTGRQDDRSAAASFADFAQQYHSGLDGPDVRRQLDYWMDRLHHLPGPLDLPTSRQRPQALSLAGESLHFSLPAGLAAELERQAGVHGRTPATVFFLSAVHVLLHRYTGEGHVSIGMPISLRPGGGAWDAAAGPYLNPVVIDAELSDDPTVAELLERNRSALAAAEMHRDYPFTRLVEQLRPNRTPNHHPLFQVMIVVEDAGDLPGFHELVATVLPEERPGIATDLAFHFSRGTDGYDVRVDYGAELFDLQAVRRLSDHLVTLLESMLSDPAVPVSELNLLTPAERSLLFDEWNDTDRALLDASMVDGIARLAEASPERVALCGSRGERITYGELWLRSAAVARALAGRGIGAEAVVGVCFERGVEMVVALLGVWRAGAAYLPLDPDFPADRLEFMVEDSGCALVLTDGTAGGLSPGLVPEVALADAEAEGSTGVVDLPPAPAAAHLAYVMYTSGSTGRPKGVEIEHGSLLNFIAAFAACPGMDDTDSILAVTTLSFDISGLEIWLPLWVGALVHVADADEVVDGPALATRLEQSGVTVMQGTPALWRMLLDAGWTGGLRKLLCGGEAFPGDLVAPLLARADEVWNVYGPTETTIWSSIHRVGDEGPVPIGKPIDNTQLYVMDRRGRPVPAGVAGELWIAGTGVARGYRARPALTAERFVASPARAGRAYRTGDLVRWRDDGSLEHLGRLDHQVKVNGFRIELGEIEAVLAEHPSVAQCVVAVRGAASDARLVAYVVWRDDPLLGSEVRRHLRGRLPDYMVPGLVVDIPAVPLTPNGKVDRRALPDPLQSVRPRDYVTPRTPVESGIAGVWAELLAVDRIGIHDNFFEVGGHSLLAIRAAALVEERLGVRLDARTMFFQTLEQVAAGVTAADAIRRPGTQ
jgi:amino acid adenylation domain-containing protein